METSAIKNAWSLTTFATGKRFSMGNCTNHETGEIFPAMCFTTGAGEKQYIKFSSKLGALSPAEMKAQLQELQVVELDKDLKFKYILCKQGESTWEEIDLFA